MHAGPHGDEGPAAGAEEHGPAAPPAAGDGGASASAPEPRPQVSRASSLRQTAGLARQDSARSRVSTGTVSFAGSVGPAGSDASSRSTRPPPSSAQESCRRLVKNQAFNAFIYLCIAFNTVTIGMNDLYVERDNAHRLRSVVDISDWAVLCVFTVEMFLKMYAWGLWSRSAEESKNDDFDAVLDEDEELTGYFSNWWNVFDCAIVVVSWATAPLIYLQNIDQSFGRIVRAIRTARPLRALRSFDGTQDVLKTFPHAIPSMRDGLTLLGFVFVVYAILGVNLFGVDGAFHGRCVVDDANNTYGTRGFLQKERGLAVVCGSSWGCDEGFRCSCRPNVLPDGTVERKPWAFLDPKTGDPGCLEMGTRRPWADDNPPIPSCPDYGMTCFNNFAVAFLTCFKTITMDNWTVTMWWAQDAVNPVVGWLYFVSLVVFVSFNIVNLYVASISTSYRQVREQRQEINRLKKARRLRNAERIAGQAEVPADEPDDEDTDAAAANEEPPFYAKILDSLRPARKALNPVSNACRRIVTYPQVIDECGQLVESDLLVLAAERDLVIFFGPEVGQWGLADKLQTTSMLSSSTTRADIKCSGISADPCRQELRSKILEHTQHMTEQSESEPVDAHDEKTANDKAPWFDYLILACIVANTITMTMEHFEGSAVPTQPGFVPEDNCCDSECKTTSALLCPRSLLKSSVALDNFLARAEFAFSVIFSFELLLKLVAYEGFRGYMLESFPFNLFDLVVVLVSDAVLVAGVFVETNINIAVLRLMRIMRAIRLATGFRRLGQLFAKAFSAFKSILYVLFVLIFWHVIGALLAMQLFSCPTRDVQECEFINGECPAGCNDLVGDPPRCVFDDSQIYEHCPWDESVNFNTFLNGIIVLCFVTTGEAWSEIMGQGMRSYASIWPGMLFFVTFHVIGFYMLYNLFIGVIVQEFELTDEQKEEQQLGLFRVKILKEIRKMRLKRRSWREREITMDAIATNTANKDCTVADDDDDDCGGMFLEEPGAQIEYNEDSPIFFGILKPPTPNEQCPDEAKNLRAYVRDVLLNVWFDRLILLTISASAVTLSMESPVKEYSKLDPEIARTADICFMSVFALEFLLKLLDRGVFWESKRGYFRVSWNILDFVILVFQVLDIIGLSGFNIIRLFRMLRPLRLLNKIKSLQLLLLAMQACAVDVLNVLLLWLFAFIVFAIFGVSLYSGKLFACNDATFVGGMLNPSEATDSPVGWRENCVGNFFTTGNDDEDSYVSDSMLTGILRPRVWSNPVDSASGLGFNFDSFGSSFQTLFEVSTFEQWASVVFALQATTSIGQQPISKFSSMNVFFLLAWLVLSCFFVLQLVIGVLVDAINQKSGKSLMTALQRNWVQVEEKLYKLKPTARSKEPTSKMQADVWRMVNNPMFQKFITSIISANICLLAAESYDMTQEFKVAVRIIDFFFIGLYLLEIFLKIFAYGPQFFVDRWNLFDFLVVVSSVVEVSAGAGSGLNALRAMRIVKVLRTIRLIRRAKRLRLILSALIRSFPHIMSSVVLLSLFIFLFAVLGVQLFGGVRNGLGIHRRNNFNNAWNGCLLLLRVLTGEDWQTVLHDCAIEYPMCTTDKEARLILGDPEAKGDCGHLTLAYFYFDLFYNIGNNILLNLFIAVLLENFFTMQSNFVLSDVHLESYQKIWRDLDPNGRGQISVWKLRDLVERLHIENNPLGSCVLASEIKFRCMRIELLEQSEADVLKFQDVATTLALHVVGAHGVHCSQKSVSSARWRAIHDHREVDFRLCCLFWAQAVLLRVVYSLLTFETGTATLPRDVEAARKACLLCAACCSEQNDGEIPHRKVASRARSR